MNEPSLIDEHLEFQFVSGQFRASFAGLLKSFEEASVQVCEEVHEADLDVPYGNDALERYDLFPARKEAKATVIFFHAGYWQSRDKRTFRFIAKALRDGGIDTILVNYPLCPAVQVTDIIDSCCLALQVIAQHSANRMGEEKPLVLAGHSAGAQIAIEVAFRLSQEDKCLFRNLAGILGISGVYELEPLIHTSLNQNLKLDYLKARQISPLRREHGLPLPAKLFVGGTETPAFQDQTIGMEKVWHLERTECEAVILPDHDHFSILTEFAKPDGALVHACHALISTRR
jgi:arylformamidase